MPTVTKLQRDNRWKIEERDPYSRERVLIAARDDTIAIYTASAMRNFDLKPGQDPDLAVQHCAAQWWESRTRMAQQAEHGGW